MRPWTFVEEPLHPNNRVQLEICNNLWFAFIDMFTSFKMKESSHIVNFHNILSKLFALEKWSTPRDVM